MSAICIGVLGTRYGRDPELRASLSGLDPRAFVLALALLAGGLVLSALRWRLLLASAGVRIGPAKATRLVFVGYFFSALLPTAVGGDFARALALRGSASLAVVGGSIVVERLLGFACLIALGLMGASVDGALAPARAALLLGAGAYLAGIAFLVFARFSDVPRGGGMVARVRGAAIRLLAQVRAFGFHGRALAWGAALSLAWQLILVAVHVILSRGLEGTAPIASLVVLVPVVQAIAMIPISIGGLGIRELGYESFFRASGFDPREGVALGLGWLAASTSLALVGGALFAWRPRASRKLDS